MTGVARRPPLAFRRSALRKQAPNLRPEGTSDFAEQTGLNNHGSRRTPPTLGALPVVSAQQASAGGLFVLAALFLFSLMYPVRFWIFGLFFQPYKLWLMVIFIPLAVMLLQGKAGKPMMVDWLMIGSTVWVLLSLLINNGVSLMVVTGGTYVLEFLGAYLLARIAIRSGADFRRMVILLFILVLLLLPLAAIESFTQVPFLANIIGPSWMPSETGARMGMRRAQTVFEHPILFGAFVSTVFGLVWYALIPNASFVGRMFLVSFVGFATLFSLSTGAFLAIIIQIALIGWELITRPHPNRWKIFGWLVIIGYIALDQVTARTPFHTLIQYAAFNSHSSYNRILIFEHGMANVKANPIFGLGFRDWVRPRWMGASFDNFWLLTAMRHGIPAFLMFAAAVVLIMLRTARQPLLDPLDRACRAGYLTALAGVIIAGGTVHYWKQLLVFVMFIFGSGVWMFTGGARKSHEGSMASEAEDSDSTTKSVRDRLRRGSEQAA